MLYPTGLDWDSISECVEWMVPFVNVARKVPVKLKNFKKVAVEDRHNIQTHTNYLDMLVGGLAVYRGHCTPLVLRHLRLSRQLPASTCAALPEPRWLQK